jgi:Uma2 family endonuclease
MRRGHRTRADIVVEILSPASALYDRTTKSDTYRAMRVREMWLVDPENQQVEVRSFDAGKTTVYKIGDILRSEVLALVQIPVASLFLMPL